MATHPKISFSSGAYNITSHKGFSSAHLAGDCKQVFIDAATTALTRGQKLVIPRSVVSLPVSDTVVLPAGLWIEMEAPAVAIPGFDTNKTIIQYGDSTSETYGAVLKLRARRSSVVGNWLLTGSIGIKINNIYESNIWIDETFGSVIGAQLLATNTASADRGVAWNNFYLGTFTNCRYALQLRSDFIIAGPSTAFINENNFYGGRFFTSSDCYATVQAGTSGFDPAVHVPVGLHQTGTGAVQQGQNSNKFFKPCFEIGGNPGTFNEQVPWLIECPSRDNEMYGARHENKSPLFMRVGAGITNIQNNIARLGYNSSSLATNDWTEDQLVDDKSQGRRGNRVIGNTRSISISPNCTASWSSGNLGKQSFQHSAAGKVQVRGFHHRDSAGRYLASVGTGILVNANSVEFPAGANEGIGVKLHTVEGKRFIVNWDTDSTPTALRLMIACFDSAGTQLTGTNPIYCAHELTVNYNAGYGGVYLSSDGEDGPHYCSFHPSVAYAEVFAIQYNTALKIKSLTITALDATSILVEPWLPESNQSCVLAKPSGTWKGNLYNGLFLANAARAAATDPAGYTYRGSNLWDSVSAS